MKATVKKWGNSAALRLPASVMKATHLELDTDVDVREEKGRIIIVFPQKLTPFCFPIKVDSMRENMTSEKLEDRVRRMQEQLRKV